MNQKRQQENNADLTIELGVIINSKNNSGTREASASQVREFDPEPRAKRSGVRSTKEKPWIFNIGSIKLPIQ